jgi:hypothetical protein
MVVAKRLGGDLAEWSGSRRASIRYPLPRDCERTDTERTRLLRTTSEEQGQTPAFGNGAVLAHRFVRLLAAEMDEHQVRRTDLP